MYAPSSSARTWVRRRLLSLRISNLKHIQDTGLCWDATRSLFSTSYLGYCIWLIKEIYNILVMQSHYLVFLNLVVVYWFGNVVQLKNNGNTWLYFPRGIIKRSSNSKQAWGSRAVTLSQGSGANSTCWGLPRNRSFQVSTGKRGPLCNSKKAHRVDDTCCCTSSFTQWVTYSLPECSEFYDHFI